MESSRIADINGWVEIKGNPISKVGVFPYSGAQVGKPFAPDDIVMVYRPEEELMDQECIDSFKLVPWIDDHAMLGSEDEDMIPAEQKGISGVIGQEVFYEAPYLKGNLKVFSKGMADQIDLNGKKDLSIGYRCLYDVSQGAYNGQKYDAIQRKIRGNHVALVDEGRSGPDVAVLDHFKFTLDTAELLPMTMTKENEIKKDEAPAAAAPEAKTAETVEERLAKIEAAIAKIVTALPKPAAADAPPAQTPILDEDPSVAAPVDAAVPEMKDEKVCDKETPEMKDEAKVTGMDAAKIRKSIFVERAQCDRLYKQLSTRTGTFDHAELSLGELARYGVKKLGLFAGKGQELAVLTGYLAGMDAVSAGALPGFALTGMDSGVNRSSKEYFDKLLNGSAK